MGIGISSTGGGYTKKAADAKFAAKDSANIFTTNQTVVGNISATGTIFSQWSGQYALSTVNHNRINLTQNQQSSLLLVDTPLSSVIIIPADSTLNLPNGFQTNISRIGTGAVVVSGAPTVTLRSADNRVNLRSQSSTATVVKLSANNWLLFGDIS